MRRAFFLVLALLALQFVPGVGAGDAQAACSSSSEMRGYCDTRGEAYAYSVQLATAKGSACTYGFSRAAWVNPPTIANAEQHWVVCQTSGGGETFWTASRVDYNGANGGCPVDAPWDEATKTCKPEFDSAECLARNADLGSQGALPRPSLSVCRNVAGCEFAMATSGPDYTETTLSDGSKLYRGVMEYTGNPGTSCTTAPVEPEAEEAIATPSPQECRVVPGGGDIPMCVKADGQQCLQSPSTGRQFCWRPGEVGEKTGGQALQKRNAGETPATPTTTPPENSTFSQDGTPVTTDVVVNNTTITTTFTNYKTTTGVDAGPNDQSEPPDGSGSPDGEDGGENDGAVLDGVDCSAQPVVTGGDPLLANVILQTWGTRCAVESAGKITSTGEIGDCTSAFSVSGEDAASSANVAKLKAARVEICGSDSDNDGIADAYENLAPTREEGIASGDTNSDGTGGGVTKEQAFGAAIEADSDDLNWNGWAGYTRTCPTIDPITIGESTTIQIPTGALCDIMQTFGHIMLLLSALVSLRIMAGGVP